MNFWSQSARSVRALFRKNIPQVREIRNFFSPALGRNVDLDVYLPPGYETMRDWIFPLVIFNDGQDLPRAGYAKTLETLWRRSRIPPFISVGVYAGPERIREYGTVRQPDYKNRGDKAPRYRDFVLGELLPYLRDQFRISELAEETTFAGFSLGGLSAFDLGWDNPDVFGTMGVFSGALWWRWANIDPRDPDAARIAHDIVRQWPGPADEQRFWFQTGTLDEEEDRNNNGVIDAIDDTLDLIRELKRKGYGDAAIRYVEIENGTHDPATWGLAMPDFLIWTLSRGRKTGSFG